MVFDVYCPRHGSRVLLFADNIIEVVNQSNGIQLRWQCFCGETGGRSFSRSVDSVGPEVTDHRFRGDGAGARTAGCHDYVEYRIASMSASSTQPPGPRLGA